MFDKVFFKFALGFTLIIGVSVCALYVASYINDKGAAPNTASVAESLEEFSSGSIQGF